MEDKQMSAFDYFLLVVMMVISLGIIVINSIVIYTLSTARGLKTKTNYIITSLAVADLCVGFLFPINALFGFKFLENIEVCMLAYCVSTLITTVSMHHLFLVSLDKFILITRPLRYSTVMTTKKCLIFIALSWISSLTFAILPKFGIGRMEHFQCNAENYYTLWYLIMVFVVNFQTPLIFMTYMYFKIYAISKRHRQQIKSEMNHFNTSARGNIRSAKILFVMCLYFLLSWMPYFITVTIPLMSGNLVVPESIVQVAVTLAFGNSLGNPLLYGFFHKDVRKSIIKIFKRRENEENTSDVTDKTTDQTRF